MEKRYIFVCQSTDESEEVFAGRKDDVETEIRSFEEHNKELTFTVIGRIEEPAFGLPLGFSESLITWYDKKALPSKRVIDQAVLAIIQLIRN